jgi:hypothetical protein
MLSCLSSRLPSCHPERSEGSQELDEILRFAQDDKKNSLLRRVASFFKNFCEEVYNIVNDE